MLGILKTALLQEEPRPLNEIIFSIQSNPETHYFHNTDIHNNNNKKSSQIPYKLPQACPCVIKVGLSNKRYKCPRRQHSCPVSMTSHNRPIWLVTLAPFSTLISGNQRKANIRMTVQRHRCGYKMLGLESFHKIIFLARFLLLRSYSQEMTFFIRTSLPQKEKIIPQIKFK